MESPVLVFVHLLAASVWIGGMVAIAVVTRVVRAQLGPREQVAFFRAVGARYGVVGGGALVVALATGAALLDGHGWDGLALVEAALGLALLAVAGVAISQARRTSRLRARVAASADARVATELRISARRAGALRALLGALSLAVLAVGAVLA